MLTLVRFARAKNDGATIMGEARGDLKFQRPNRILHRQAALPSLEGVFQIWSSQARPKPHPAPLPLQHPRQYCRSKGRRRYAVVAASI